MRISEKTLELTFCHQIGSHLLFPHLVLFPTPWPWRLDIIWFGLTQRQEARLGFDLATRVGGRILLLQFKASNKVLRNGRRRFFAPHVQMQNLRNLCRGQRAIYYVLPNIGVSSDLATNPCILPQSWFLDVQSLPQPLPQATTNSLRGAPHARKSGNHYIDLDVANHQAIIHSEPFRRAIKRGDEWLRDVLAAPKTELGLDPRAFTEVTEGLRFHRGAIGGIVHDRKRLHR